MEKEEDDVAACHAGFLRDFVGVSRFWSTRMAIWLVVVASRHSSVLGGRSLLSHGNNDVENVMI
jgi:hypothetical protein